MPGRSQAAQRRGTTRMNTTVCHDVGSVCAQVTASQHLSHAWIIAAPNSISYRRRTTSNTAVPAFLKFQHSCPMSVCIH